MSAPVRRPRRRKPFATVKQQTSGWWAFGASGGIGSGPWPTEAKAQEVADAWNAATALPGDPS